MEGEGKHKSYYRTVGNEWKVEEKRGEEKKGMEKKDKERKAIRLFCFL